MKKILFILLFLKFSHGYSQDILTTGGYNGSASATNLTGIVPIVNGGTNASTANAGLNNLLPSQISNSGKYLTTDGTSSSWNIPIASYDSTHPLGNVMSDDFTSGHYSVTGAATFSFVAGGILVSGGTGAVNTDYLTYNNWVSASDNFALTLEYVITGTGYGLGIGVKSVNASFANSVFTQFNNTTSGTDLSYIYCTKQSRSVAAQVTSTAGAVAWSVNDTIVQCLKRVGDAFYLSVTNKSTNVGRTTISYVSDFYNYPIATTTPLLNNRFKYAIESYGGTQKIVHLSFDVFSNKGAKVAIIGDSKAQGYYAGQKENALFRILSPNQDDVVNLSGSGDRTVEAVLCNAEITALAPKNLIMWIGCNDIADGVASGTWQANYASIVSNAQSAGATVWHVLCTPENDYNISALNTWINATYPSDHIINAYTPMADTKTRLKPMYDCGDHLHLSPLGNFLLKYLIRIKLYQKI